MKKILLFLLSFIIAFHALCSVEIDGIYYNLDSSRKTAEVSRNDNKYTGSVVIPSVINYQGAKYAVTSIESYAFSGCSDLTSISIPNSVTRISEYAFNGCSGLTSIIVDSGNSAYDSRNNCNAIIRTSSNTLVVGCKNTVIPNGVTSIDSYAFYGCSGLASIAIPSSVTSISEYAFSGCTSLASIAIPNSMASIGNSAFSGCTSLTSITIPNSMTSISEYAFSGCTSLASITIPNSVTSIGEYAFRNCKSLTVISIPISVTSIGSYAFNGCSGLTSIIVDTENSTYDSRNNCNAIISTASNTLVVGCKNTVIPNGVTSIGSYAFYDCSSLASITIPNSVTSIRGRAFSGCTSLTSITIPNSVKSIDNYAFYDCSSLSSITIPNSMGSIGDYAFSGCSSLTSIAIPENMTSIGSKAFSDCSSLNTVIINSNTIASKSYDDVDNFASKFGNQVQEYVLRNGITKIGYSAFRDCSGITSITIPASVTRIGKNAFRGCKLHNILVMGGTPPEIDASSFTNMIHQHTILYVPAGCWDAYAFDDNWYVFNTIRELAIKENQVSKRQTYMLMDTNNFSYSVYDPVNKCVGTINSFNNVNEDNPNHCWQLLEAAGNHYMYNVGAKKFLVKANDKTGFALSIMPVAINLQDSDDGIILGGDSSKRWAFVRNESTFADQQIITSIDFVNGSTTTDKGPVYNLSGQRTVESQKGVNIINGRKVLAK